MGQPILNSCCRCATLKTGTIITGVIGIILAIISTIVIFVTKVKIRTFILQDLDPLIVRIIIAINMAMTVLISTLLIIGALKRNRFMMLPWIILAITTAIGLIFSILYTTVVLFIDNHNWTASILLIIGLTTAGVTIYLWLVVLSFYQVISEEKSRGPYHRPPYQTYQ